MYPGEGHERLADIDKSLKEKKKEEKSSKAAFSGLILLWPWYRNLMRIYLS